MPDTTYRFHSLRRDRPIGKFATMKNDDDFADIVIEVGARGKLKSIPLTRLDALTLMHRLTEIMIAEAHR